MSSSFLISLKCLFLLETNLFFYISRSGRPPQPARAPPSTRSCPSTYLRPLAYVEFSITVGCPCHQLVLTFGKLYKKINAVIFPPPLHNRFSLGTDRSVRPKCRPVRRIWPMSVRYDNPGGMAGQARPAGEIIVNAARATTTSSIKVGAGGTRASRYARHLCKTKARVLQCCC